MTLSTMQNVCINDARSSMLCAFNATVENMNGKQTTLNCMIIYATPFHVTQQAQTGECPEHQGYYSTIENADVEFIKVRRWGAM